MNPDTIIAEIETLSGPGRVSTIRKQARELRRWIRSQPPEQQAELLERYTEVLRWIPADQRRRSGDRHLEARPQDRHRTRPLYQSRDGLKEWQRAITAIDGEGWGLEVPEGRAEELLLDPAPDPWPPIRKYIRSRLGVQAPRSMVPLLRPLGILPPGWGIQPIGGGVLRNRPRGVAPDVLKVELPVEVPEAKGLWAPDASVEEMFHVLHALWEDSTNRPRRTRVRWYGRQVYRLLVAATLYPDGRVHPWILWRGGERLTTAEILNRISDMPYPGHMVGFGLGYDWAHWLLDLADRRPDDLRALHEGQTVRYQAGHPQGTYELKMIPGKFLEIHRLHPGRPRRRIVHDAFSWYQTSFEKALEDTLAIPQSDREIIKAGKGRRGDQADHEVEEEALYSAAENRSLAKMQRHLYQLCTDAGYPLNRFNGPGSLAEVMLEQAGVLEHFCPIPEHAEQDLLKAHFGGRFEDAAVGRFQKLYYYDINSAYPWAAANLPSFKGARWEHVHQWQPGELGCYRVRFAHSRRDYWGAFPVRGRHQEIFFPRAGETWVWSPELQAARGYWPFKIVEGWRVSLPAPAPYPLAFLQETYRERKRLADAQDPLAKVFKLGPNSLYGKLSQTVGLPRYRFLPWASLITSMTRALLLQAIRLAGPGQVIGTATDGIYVRRPLDLPPGGMGGLGDWAGPEPRTSVLLVGSGFMKYRESQKTRGVKAREMEAEATSLKPGAWERLGQLWDSSRLWEGHWENLGRLRITVEHNQFCGIGLGLLWNHPEMIGSWIQQERMVTFESQKSPGISGRVPGQKAVWRLQRTQDRPRVCYPYDGFKDYARELEDAEEEGIGAI